MSQETRIPDIGDLLGPMFRFKDPKLAESAANNVMVPVNSGLEAIGELLWVASQADEPVESHTLGNIGCLISFLAELSDRMHHASCNASYQQGEDAKNGQSTLDDGESAERTH